MTDMKWTTVKRKRKGSNSEQHGVSLKEDLSEVDSGVGRVTDENVAQSNGYVRRQRPKSSSDSKVITAEQEQLIQTLYLNLETIAEQVMATKRSDVEAHEQALKEIRSLLDRINIIDPSRYETPLGSALETAIYKIYTVVA